MPDNAMFGATPDKPVGGMFSFVPCRPAEDRELTGFPRPRIDHHPAINPNNLQAIKQNKPILPPRFPDLWHQVADTVTGAGLALATRLDPPPEDVFDRIVIH